MATSAEHDRRDRYIVSSGGELRPDSDDDIIYYPSHNRVSRAIEGIWSRRNQDVLSSVSGTIRSHSRP